MSEPSDPTATETAIEDTRVTIASGPELVAWLTRAGIAHADQHVRRVIIDLKVGHPVEVYTEQCGDRRLFKVDAPDLSGAKITRAEE